MPTNNNRKPHSVAKPSNEEGKGNGQNAPDTDAKGAAKETEGEQLVQRNVLEVAEQLASAGQSDKLNDAFDNAPTSKADNKLVSIREANAKAFAELHKRERGALIRKSELMLEAAQTFAEASDYQKEGSAKAREAEEVTMRGVKSLYQGVREHLFTKAEITAILGKSFGFKQRIGTDGKQTDSKTPLGAGEAARKRIERLRAASDYAEAMLSDPPKPHDAGRYFEGMDPKEVAGLLEEVDKGLSPWTAYDRFDDLKPDRVSLPFHLNFNKLADFREKLADESSWAEIIGDNNLSMVYRSIFDTIVEMGLGEPIEENESEAA